MTARVTTSLPAVMVRPQVPGQRRPGAAMRGRWGDGGTSFVRINGFLSK